MKRTTVFLDETIERRLEQQARRRRQPKAVLIREALAEYLERRAGDRPKQLEFVASGRSGRSDGAERHEELLWRDSGTGDEPGA